MKTSFCSNILNQVKQCSLIFCFLLFAGVSSSQIPNYVPTQGLQGYWPFSGNANDLSGNNYNGTVNGAVLTNDRFNTASSAYSFNGVSDFISTNYAGILGSNPRAVSFWAKSSSTQGMSAVCWGDNTQSSRFDCYFNYATTGPTIDGAYTAITYNSPSAVNDNQWHHYVYQFSAPSVTAVQIYQDAVLLTQTNNIYIGNAILNTLSNFNVTFGTIVYPAGPDYFDGCLDDIGIWNRTLTPCEIQQLFKSQLPTIQTSSSASVICAGAHATLSASGATNYTWTALGNGASIVVNPVSTTVYTVSGTTTLGCIATATLQQTVKICNGLTDYANRHTISVYPNPGSGVFVISTPHEVPAEYAELSDGAGNCVMTQKLNSLEENKIDLRAFDNGLYILKTYTKDNKPIGRVKLILTK